MLRRSLLVSAAPAALLFTGCHSDGTSAALTPAQVVADANGLAANLAAALPGLLAAGVLPSRIEAPVLAAMQTAQKLLTGLSTALPATSGASLLQQVQADLGAVLTTLGGLGVIPAPYGAIVSAAPVVLSAIEAFVQQYIPSAAKPAAGASAGQLNGARGILGIPVLA